MRVRPTLKAIEKFLNPTKIGDTRVFLQGPDFTGSRPSLETQHEKSNRPSGPMTIDPHAKRLRQLLDHGWYYINFDHPSPAP